MTDRELLELAAKAIGLELGPDSPWRTYSKDYGFEWWNEDGRSCLKRWRPLTEDGDALRLAVQLCLSVEVWAGSSRHAQGVTLVEHDVVMVEETHKGDAQAATRRAIVRAAAEIQNAKEDQ